MVRKGKKCRCTFWSSVEYASFMTGLVNELNAQGCSVEHRFNISHDCYRQAVSPVQRLLLRLRMSLVYPLQLLWYSMVRRSPEITVVCTNTFYAPLIAALAAGKRGRVVHLVYDLFPDALIQAGQIADGGLAERILSRLAKLTFQRCHANVFLGSKLLQHARQRHGEIPNASVIPVGADSSRIKASWPKKALEMKPITVLYCGNMGRMHDVDTVLGYLGRESDCLKSASQMRLLFHASGVGYERLKRELNRSLKRKDVEIALRSSLPEAQWIEVLREAEVALVTMTSGAERIVMPSKAYSALLAGHAILAVCERNSTGRETCWSMTVDGWFRPAMQPVRKSWKRSERTRRTIRKRERAYEGEPAL